MGSILIGGYVDRFMEFELEFDGATYTIEAEYSVSDASFDHAFGTEKRYDVDVASFKVYLDGYLLIPIDQSFIKSIFKECDRLSKDVSI